MPRRNRLVHNISAIAIIISAIIGGCASQHVNAVPFLPPTYFNAIEVNPQELINAYYYAGLPGYIDIREPEARYNNKIFVFKDVLVDEWLVRMLDKGVIWLDLIKCGLINRGDMLNFDIGDRIDVVGINLGPDDPNNTGLTFKDCYVLPAGVVKLPAGDDGVAVVPAY